MDDEDEPTVHFGMGALHTLSEEGEDGPSYLDGLLSLSDAARRAYSIGPRPRIRRHPVGFAIPRRK